MNDDDDACVGRHMPGRTPMHLRMSVAATEAGAVAAKAEHLKSAKYATLKVSHHFVPFAVETSGVLSQAALSLVWDIG